MPERDDMPGPEPMDEAYLRAEQALDDEAARTARRARILAAVAKDAETPPAPAPSVRRGVRRYGGWLAAACVAGLSVWTAQKVYRPAPPPQPPVTSAVAVRPAPAVEAPPTPIAKPPAPLSISPKARSTPPPIVAPRRSAIAEPVPALPADVARPLPLPPVERPVAPPPPIAIAPPAPIAQAPAFAPAPPPPPPPAALAAKPGSATQEAVVVTGSRIRRRDMTTSSPVAAKAIDGAFRLREAASAGRTADVEALLAQGAPVDAADDQGETALMKSIEASHGDTAALLLRHGASLDLKNHAGVSARDMAAKKDDAALDQALGLTRQVTPSAATPP